MSVEDAASRPGDPAGSGPPLPHSVHEAIVGSNDATSGNVAPTLNARCADGRQIVRAEDQGDHQAGQPVVPGHERDAGGRRHRPDLRREHGDDLAAYERFHATVLGEPPQVSTITFYIVMASFKGERERSDPAVAAG